MASILSTKKLNSSQKEMFLNENISYMEYDSISIELIDFNSPILIKNAIFSSQNALKSIEIHKKELFLGHIENSFCIGQNVKDFLTKKGQNVVKMCKNARELSDYIIKTHKTEGFHYFCGDIRLDEIPQRFREENINLTEIINYKTSAFHRKFEQIFDAVIFFSPSAVRSYFSTNHIEDKAAICIGETTAKEVRKHTNKLIIANTTSIESVINSSIKYIKTL